MTDKSGKMRIALVGAGGMGLRWAGVISRSPDAELAAVFDADANRAKDAARAYGGRPVHDLKEILRDPAIDAGVVVLPHKFLASASEQLLQNGKHVLSEKPGARTPGEIMGPLKTAESRDLRFMVGFNHRFHQSHQKAKELAEQGAIGEILFLRARYGFGGRPGYEKEWRHDKDMSGGGELIDQGVHLIDLARYFLGDIAEAKGFVQDAFWKSGVEDNAFLLLKDARGRVASLHASWSQWKPKYALEIFGDKGYILIEGLGKKYGGTERVIIGKRADDFSAAGEETVECDTDADKSLAAELQEFISAIREKRQSVPHARDALAALSIVQDIYAAEKK